MNASFPIFLNPRAGRGADAEQDALLTAFNAVGVRPDINVIPGNELEAAIREEATRVPIIGVAGGDGTISSAAHALVDSSTALLPIPLGTLNHFSNRYGISSVEAAARAMQRSEQTLIHVGSVNDRTFVNNASCGFYPHLVRHRERMERFMPRLVAMWVAAGRVLAEMPMMTLDIEIRGSQRHLHTPAMWVGIGRNSLRIPIPGDAEVEGNVLEIVAAETESRREVLGLSLRLLRHLRKDLEPRAENLVVERATTFTVKSRHNVDIALDGEPFRLRNPLTFALLPNALKVVCLVGTDEPAL